MLTELMLIMLAGFGFDYVLKKSRAARAKIVICVAIGTGALVLAGPVYWAIEDSKIYMPELLPLAVLGLGILAIGYLVLSLARNAVFAFGWTSMVVGPPARLLRPSRHWRSLISIMWNSLFHGKIWQAWPCSRRPVRSQ